jgi:hypothetical protein
MRRRDERAEHRKLHVSSMTSRDKLPPKETSPGVPFFRTWRGVYVFVLVAFVAVVALLAVFSRTYA